MRLKIVLILFIMFYSVNCLAVLPKAKFTIKVVDTMGNPIEGADAFASFNSSTGKIATGTTDKNGIFTAEGATTTHFGVTVDKEGYYRSGYSFRKLLKRGKGFPKRYIPWNPTIEIILKDIRNPIPMYAKGTFGYIKIPVLEQPIGYDLEAGDWVAPYGKGIINDFILVCKARYDGIKDWETSYELTFSNEHDGIQEYYPDKDDKSEYFWPYEAPVIGYKTEINLFKIFTPDGHFENNYDKKRKYIFRVRTKVDTEGNIVEAKYGKMTGDITVTRIGNISFGYYLNPTGTRNIEYGSNLFKSDKNKYPY